MAYTPRTVPDRIDIDGLGRYLYEEFIALARTLAEMEEVELRERNAAPESPRIGMIVYADGTNWDPGSGEGLYVYKSGGWTFIV